jgi:geranylgeranyl diphosphate synthase type II
MNIRGYLSARKKLIDSNILKYLPKGSKYTKVLFDSMKYSLASSGKRIRPIMVMAACEAVGGRKGKTIPLACAVEMIHTYTLIHDDLPSMDNDDLRRGKPTNHKVFGEDMAILAGDALNTLAFEVIAVNYGVQAGKLVKELSSSLGISGVVGGQVADICSTGRKIGKAELDFITLNKTAMLFVSSVRCGAILGGANSRELRSLTSYATHVGLAFQIIDDILDYKRGDKNNYPAVLGMSHAERAGKEHLDIALRALPKNKKYGVLRSIALFLAERKE